MIERNFNAASISYDRVAHVQRASARRLVDLIQKDTPCTRLLDVGTGTGYAAQLCYEKFPLAQITLNDISPSMLDAATARFQGVSSIISHCGNAEYEVFSNTYDIIVSNLAIQWFDNWQAGIKNLFKQTQAIAFSTLTRDTFSEWQQLFDEKNLSSALRQYPTLAELTDFARSLTSGSVIVDHVTVPLTFQGPEDFITYLKALGAQTPRPSLRKNDLKYIWSSIPRPLTVSYHIFYGLLIKGKETL